MNLIFNLLVLCLTLLSLASVNSSNQSPCVFAEANWLKETTLLEKDGITVCAWNFNLYGDECATLEFRNTTNEAIRLLWSVQVKGANFAIRTTQAYLTIPAGESLSYGHSKSEDPLIEVNSYFFDKEIIVHIEIQELL
jgi:hypothetical protein